jgi:hypothetical protein
LGQLEESLGIAVRKDTNEDGVDNYVQAIFPHLLEVVARPEDLKLPSLGKDSPIWRWLEMAKPPGGESGTMEERLRALVRLFGFLSEQNHRQELARYMLARVLRQEYGLNRGRKVATDSSLQSGQGSSCGPPVSDSISDLEWEAEYAAVEQLMTLERPSCLRFSSPAGGRRDLLGSRNHDCTVAETCRRLGKDPNLVRNNFQAFRRLIKKDMPDL